MPYIEFIQYLESIGVGYIVATDISKDGTLTGPNFEMYDEIAKNSQIQFVVSGGIKDFDNIQKVAQKDYYACIVGKAYYEKKIDCRFFNSLFHYNCMSFRLCIHRTLHRQQRYRC